MANAIDKILDTAGRVAAGAAKQAGRLVNKGYDKATEVSLQAKKAKLQRQLGALVYALRKNDEENEPMVAWYVGEIDKIKAQISTLRTRGEAEEDHIVVLNTDEEAKEDGAAEGDGDAFFRGGDGE